MATSGIKNFEETRNEIVRAAYENCRVAIDGEELTAEQMKKGVRELNSLMKFWQAQGFHLWKLGEGWLFAKKGQAQYKLGKTGDLAAVDVNINKVISHVYAGYNQFFVDKHKLMPSVGDFIGIVTQGNNLFFSTVTEIDNMVVKIADVLPRCVCHGAPIYFFATNKKIDRPLKILQARRYQIGGSEIEMVNLANAEYFKLPQKEQEGTPTSWTYVPTLNNGTFYLWNTPSDNSFIIKFTYEQEFDILVNSKDTPDIASEWIEPLTWELAYRLSAVCGLDLNEREWLKAQAKETLKQAETFDQETGGFQIVPQWRV
jgi:hypothetical protein